MRYFQVRYDSRVINYVRRGLIRLATGVVLLIVLIKVLHLVIVTTIQVQLTILFAKGRSGVRPDRRWEGVPPTHRPFAEARLWPVSKPRPHRQEDQLLPCGLRHLEEESEATRPRKFWAERTSEALHTISGRIKGPMLQNLFFQNRLYHTKLPLIFFLDLRCLLSLPHTSAMLVFWCTSVLLHKCSVKQVFWGKLIKCIKQWIKIQL